MNQKTLNNLLIEATESGNLNEVKKYLDQGANVYAYNDYAICWAVEKGYTEIAKLLIIKEK